MKVLINYEPLELISVCAKIKEEYKNRYDYKNPPTGHLDKLIKEISTLGMVELEDYALMLTEHDVNCLAYHLPTEENMILNRKMFNIISSRISKQVFEAYFLSWQKNYNKLSNKMGERNLFELSNRVEYLSKNVYNRNLQMQMMLRNADELLAEYVADFFDKGRGDTDEMLYNIFSISPDSVLGVNIRKKIYICCSERQLLKVSDDRLCDISVSYTLEDKIKFFLNFLTKVNPEHFKNYIKLAEVARLFFNKESAEFEKLPLQIKIKLQMWFSLRDIDRIFGIDERGIFWKARAIENHAIRVEKIHAFNMVIMHFEKFVATEFILKNDGPIYIVSNEEYNTIIYHFIVRSNSKTELKSKLYEYYRDTSNRIQHRGDWRANVHRMIEYLK